MKIIKDFNQLWNRHRSVDENWYTYLFFAVLRLVLVFIPQLGYVHPDEFFQSVEVINGDHFKLEHVRTWEFNNTMPLRSMTLPFLLLRVPWSFMEFCAIYLRTYANIELIHSYTYLVFPRLIYCLLSFLIDWSLYEVCRIYSLRYEIRLLALGSSWVILIFGTRTFSNTIEMVLCSVLLYLVADCMIKTNTIVYKKEYLDDRYDKAQSIGEKVKLWKLKNSLPPHNFKNLFIVSSICSVGVFNRPTFLLFGAPMVFYWMLRGMGTKTITFRDFNLRIACFCLSAIPAIALFIFCDSLYYKHLTSGELHMLDIGITNFIFIPWNFIKYNLDANKTAEHGLHPKYNHLLVNIPLLYNILGIIAMVSFAQLMIRFFRAEYQGLPRAQSIVGLMSGAIFVPLFFLSLINHQEPRFLIPLTFPIILLHGPKLITGFCSSYPFREEHPFLRQIYHKVLCTEVSASYITKVWYTFNILCVIFFGFIHQAGVFPLSQHMESVMRSKERIEQVHLITSHIYNMPLSFVNLPSSKMTFYNHETKQRFKRHKDFYLYEYGSMELQQLMHKIQLILSHCEMKWSTKKQPYSLFVALPTSLTDHMANARELVNSTRHLRFERQRVFYPHLSTEAMPSIHTMHPCDDLTLYHGNTMCHRQKSSLSITSVIDQISSFIQQFGLALYKVQVKLDQS